MHDKISKKFDCIYNRDYITPGRWFFIITNNHQIFNSGRLWNSKFGGRAGDYFSNFFYLSCGQINLQVIL